MPWCEDCSKYWSPNTMPPDGTCPSCGDLIAEPPDDTIPWHFWILAVGIIGYLGWRYVQLLQWLDGNGHGVIALVLGGASLAVAAWGLVVFLRRDRTLDDGAAPDADAEAADRGTDVTDG